MGYVDKAVSALLTRGQTVRWIVFDGSKMSDITHADITEHTLTPAPGGPLPGNTQIALVQFRRIAGTGDFIVMTTTGGAEIVFVDDETGFWPITDTGAFRYRLSVANDDWDLHLFGVLQSGRVLG